MTQKPLYRSLDANLALLEEMFGRSDDFYTKRLMLAGIPCAIVMRSEERRVGKEC